MTVNILSESDIAKIIAFLRVRAGATFHVRTQLLDELMKRVEDFARDNEIRLERCEPSDRRKSLWTGGGALAGGIAGLKFAGLIGAGVGALVGGVAGYGCAHLELFIEPRLPGSDEHVVIRMKFA